MITNTAERDRIEAVFAKNAKKAFTTDKGGYANSINGPCIVRMINGSTSFFVKTAKNGSWAGWYSNGVLQHEEVAA